MLNRNLSVSADAVFSKHGGTKILKLIS